MKYLILMFLVSSCATYYKVAYYATSINKECSQAYTVKSGSKDKLIKDFQVNYGYSKCKFVRYDSKTKIMKCENDYSEIYTDSLKECHSFIK